MSIMDSFHSVMGVANKIGTASAVGTGHYAAAGAGMAKMRPNSPFGQAASSAESIYNMDSKVGSIGTPKPVSMNGMTLAGGPADNSGSADDVNDPMAALLRRRDSYGGQV